MNFSLQLLNDLSPKIVPPFIYSIQYSSSIDCSVQENSPTTASSDVLDTIVEENIRLTQSDWYQDVRHIKLKFPSPIQPPIYAAGDITEVALHIHDFIYSVNYRSPLNNAGFLL